MCIRDSLQSKGFPDARTLVDADGSMIIPMRDCMSGNLLGVQKIRLVDNQWQKKMLPVSYTHLRAHETVLDLVCRLLLEKKKQTIKDKMFV